MKKITLLIVLTTFIFSSCEDYRKQKNIEAITTKTDEYYTQLYSKTLSDALSDKEIFPESIDSIKTIMDSLKKENPQLANDFIREKWELYKKIADSISDKETEDILKEHERRFGKTILKNNYTTKSSFEDNLSNWDGSLPSLVEFTKKNLNDPNSFEHVETGYIIREDYVEVQMIYRARNGFNALIKSKITAAVDSSGNLIKIISAN